MRLYLYNAGAASINDRAIPYPRESVTDAQSGLARMGYDPVDMRIGLTTDFRSNILDMLPKRAFYVNWHGSLTTIRIGKSGYSLKYTEIPSGTYQFVF